MQSYGSGKLRTCSLELAGNLDVRRDRDKTSAAILTAVESTVGIEGFLC